MWVILIAVLVAACAVLAANGFRGRVTMVGIDLGTTYSVVGVNEGGVIRIIGDSQGHVLVPSMVSFMRGGQVAVGRAARALAGNDTAITIYEAKRLIGREFGGEEGGDMGAQAAGRPYSLVPKANPDDDSDAWFDLTPLRQPLGGAAAAGAGAGAAKTEEGESESSDESGDGDGDAWARGGYHPPSISPQGVGALVVKELLRMVRADLGHSQVRAAVIAVPAKFTPRQRRATGEAFKAAGLKVQRVLEEPTAAALAYGLQHRKDVHYVLVYDFGGGTLDVSLLYVAEGSVQVIASEGDDALGGGDFDRVVAALITERLGADTVPDTVADACAPPPRCAAALAAPGGGGEGAAAADVSPPPLCATRALRGEAERVKQELSSAAEATARCLRPVGGAGAAGAGACPAECAAWEARDVTISREQFEAAAAPLFARALIAVDRLLEHSEHRAEEIDEAVLVGGTSRMPRLRADLQSHLRLDHLNTHIDPDVTVAYGAATVAH